jgi:hypothetical protein
LLGDEAAAGEIIDERLVVMMLAGGAGSRCRARMFQMVDILNAVLTDGLPAVEAACAEALAHFVDEHLQRNHDDLHRPAYYNI